MIPPATPAHRLEGYRFDPRTCACAVVPCANDPDCATAGEAVCDTSQGVCAASRSIATCAAAFTCVDHVQPGGTCNCHEDCQCDPDDVSGHGATYGLGAGGTCMPRCGDQADPALFCACYQQGTCAPNGACEVPCTAAGGCQSGACTNGLCERTSSASIDTGACADAGSGDAATDGGG